MSSRGLNIISNFYFVLILSLGVVYAELLLLGAHKAIPAFLMQIVFLLDILKFGESARELVLSGSFWMNTIPGIIFAALIFHYLRQLIKSIRGIRQLRSVIKNLKTVNETGKMVEFESDQPSIFTSGFLKPRIYVSSTLYMIHQTKEIKAMIEHEVNHQKNLHPAKIFAANLIKSTIPHFPGKAWLIDNYLTLTEVACDRYSEEKLQDKVPLVSALLKFQEQNSGLGWCGFNSQSERIKILVGQKKQHLRLPTLFFSFMLIVFFSAGLVIKNNNFLYDCQHLVKCVKALISPDSPPLITLTSIHNNQVPVSDHCQ